MNTVVSSPAMEAEAVKEIWLRSEDMNRLRYTSYIGDGDSKGYQCVCDARPYGEKKIEKEECVGHVQKRLGRSLINLKQRCGSRPLSDGKPIGGRGRLTAGKIDSLQNYYGDAIRKNGGDVTATARAIWASLMHNCTLSNASESHQFCPDGTTSWCRWKRQKAGGTGQEQVAPSSNIIPKAIFTEIKPVYIRLAEKSLLERCSHGATQNVNEALNGTIWHLCPKVSFCNVGTVQTAVHLAVIIFNDGYERLAEVIRRMECSGGGQLARNLAAFDKEKLYHKRRKSSQAKKSARKQRRARKKGFQDRAQETEEVS